MTAEMVKAALKEYGGQVDAYVSRCLGTVGAPATLRQAMEYSLLAGGKRVRPVLCLACAELFGGRAEAVLPFAAGIECIHCYSLIHDDLPAMDDDDLRRGKPSNHKVYGEAMAILAGDALLTEAFSFMGSVASDIAPELVLAALLEVASAAGAGGMVGGQALDMEYTGRDNVDFQDLRTMHAMKTGALITCACVGGAILAGGTPEDVARLREYGRCIGAAFQIADDILDEVGDEKAIGKPVGSDREQGKVTYPSLLGLDKSRELAQEFVDTAVSNLAPYSGEQAGFLRSLAQYIVDRVY